MSYPANYRYTKEHEWIQVDGKIGTVGITDYAQNSLGDIVFVDLPRVGDTIEAAGWPAAPELADAARLRLRAGRSGRPGRWRPWCCSCWSWIGI